MLSRLTFLALTVPNGVVCCGPMPQRFATTQRTARHAGAALLFALAISGAHAAPDVHPVADPLGRLLTDSGIANGASAIVNAPVAAASPVAAVPGSLANKIREQASDMVVTAMNFLGVKYRRGGSDADVGFDCSGFTRHVFEMSVGLVLPRRVDEQAKAPGLVPVKRDELQPGDLVFFNTLKRTFSHVGIYVGDGKFIHSPRPGGEVRVEDMGFAYWKKRFTGARRAGLTETAAASADTGAAAVASTEALTPAAAAAPAQSRRHSRRL
jgi:cell wall-associated NlpC family hydrolase